MPQCHLIQYQINFHWLRYKCSPLLSITLTFTFKLQLVNFYIRLQKVSRPIGRGKRCKLFMLNDISFEDDTLSVDPRQKKRSNDTNHNRKCVEMHLKLNWHARSILTFSWIQFMLKELWRKCIWDFCISLPSKYLRWKGTIMIVYM